MPFSDLVEVSFFCAVCAFMGLGSRVWVLGVSVPFCSWVMVSVSVFFSGLQVTKLGGGYLFRCEC